MQIAGPFILWDNIARPHRKPFGLFYPLETCFCDESFHPYNSPSKIYSVKKIKKSIVKSEKLHCFYFLGYFSCVMTCHIHASLLAHSESKRKNMFLSYIKTRNVWLNIVCVHLYDIQKYCHLLPNFKHFKTKRATREFSCEAHIYGINDFRTMPTFSHI